MSPRVSIGRVPHNGGERATGRDALVMVCLCVVPTHNVPNPRNADATTIRFDSAGDRKLVQIYRSHVAG